MSLITRTREFHPDDNAAVLTNEQIDERLQELAEKRAAMDPEKQFTGLKRLGDSYSAAEALAFIDGPTGDQLKFGRATYSGIFVSTGMFAGMMMARLRFGTYFSGVGFAIMAAAPLWYIGGKMHDYQLYFGKKRELNYLHYALMHEKDIPRVERKTYGQIMYPWPAHRSLNKFGPNNQ